MFPQQRLPQYLPPFKTYLLARSGPFPQHSPARGRLGNNDLLVRSGRTPLERRLSCARGFGHASLCICTGAFGFCRGSLRRCLCSRGPSSLGLHDCRPTRRCRNICTRAVRARLAEGTLRA